MYRERIAKYEELVADLARRSGDHASGPPDVLGLRPPAGTPCVGQLERDPALLTAGAADGARLVEAALGGRAASVAPR
jgi:hypothetical protein